MTRASKGRIRKKEDKIKVVVDSEGNGREKGKKGGDGKGHVLFVHGESDKPDWGKREKTSRLTWNKKELELEKKNRRVQ